MSSQTQSLPTYTAEDVAKHNTSDDLWVSIDDNVYDLSKFTAFHPGGKFPLTEVAGQDATDAFYGLHRSEILEDKKWKRLVVGKLQGGKPALRKADEVVPYGEAAGYWRKHSPYYNESHHAFRKAIRGFIDEHIRPTAADEDEKGTDISLELNQKMADFGILASIVGSMGEKLRIVGVTELPGGVALKDFDVFHELIFSEEIKREGSYGYADGLIAGFSIGLPPILYFGSQELIDRVVPGIIKGDKRICLAISEPYAGSDVAQIKTRAIKSADGKHWVLNGVKKWITGGRYADYFTTLCQTPEGPTMLLVEREHGVETKEIKTSYSASAGTAYVEFDNTMVPIANQVGKAGHGFMYTMKNFNKERWGMVASGNRMSRLMVEECFKWAMQRQVFGKRLIDQPVIRMKLAEMAAEVESVHSMLEDVTFQMSCMTESEVNKYLAGPISLLKYKQTRAATKISDNACQIFGGRALTKSGMGKMVEKFQRSFKMQAILGGSEEILADFAIRQAMRTEELAKL
jgi:alkylation response protein AidB-like acyl-CoA dehydrogenase/predicted heme/steroid binding protein